MKKTLRQRLSLVMAVMLLITSCPVNVFAEEAAVPAQGTETTLEQTLEPSSPSEAGYNEADELDEETLLASSNEAAYVEENEKASQSIAECEEEKEATSSDAAYFDCTSEAIDGIKVRVTAEEGAFPANSKLVVKKVAKTNEDVKDIEAAVNNAKIVDELNGEEENEDEKESYTFDIKVVDEDGKELQPADGSKVNVQFELVKNSGKQLTDAKVYHLEETDETKIEKLEELVKEAEEAAKKANSKEEAEDTFDYSLLDGEVIDNVNNKTSKIKDAAAKLVEVQEAESNKEETEELAFEESNLVAAKLDTKVEENEESNVVVTTTDGFSYYVVEFYYGTLEYVLDGDSEIELSVILKALELDETIDESKITKIEVSDDTLFNPEYKAKDADSNEKVWYIRALKAFSTEEWMKISVEDENGKVKTYEIKVTDAAHNNNDCITFSSDASFTLVTGTEGITWDGVVYFSTNKSTWTEWDGSSISAGQSGSNYYIYLYGTDANTYLNNRAYGWELTPTDGHKIACTGNIETLRGATGTNPSSTQMGVDCYSYLFSECRSLTTAPDLPATNLSQKCYYAMFSYCKALTTAPALPATTLASMCYYNMFESCESLTAAPELPANTLAQSCYQGMFKGCSALKVNTLGGTKIFTCPSTESVIYPVKYMFSYTGGDFNGTPEAGTTYYVGEVYKVTFNVQGHGTAPTTQKVLPNGKATKPTDPSATGYEFGGWYKESGCTNAWNFDTDTITENKTLYALWYKLNEDCITFTSDASFTLSATKGWPDKLYYSTDKRSWTEWDGSSIAAAQTGGAGNYNLCLYGTSENTVITRGTSWTLTPTDGHTIACSGNIETLRGATGNNPSGTDMASSCYSYMFKDCTALTTAPKLPAKTLASSCYSYMFYGCTALTTVPELPAETLATSCYSNMFQNCSIITTVPELPAKTLVSGCYYFMFSGCRALKINTIGGTKIFTCPSTEGVPTSVSAMFLSTSGDFTFTPEAGVTYYVGNVYKISYNAMGRGTAPATEKVVEGGKATKPVSPIATGYAFAGWYKEYACTNVWNFDTDTVTESKTLFAKWVAASIVIESGSGVTSYNTLGEAITAAKSGDTIKITKDVSEESAEYSINTGVTLDVAGNTLTVSDVNLDGTLADTGNGDGAIVLKNGELAAGGNTYIPLYDSTLSASAEGNAYRLYKYEITMGKAKSNDYLKFQMRIIPKNADGTRSAKGFAQLKDDADAGKLIHMTKVSMPDADGNEKVTEYRHTKENTQKFGGYYTANINATSVFSLKFTDYKKLEGKIIKVSSNWEVAEEGYTYFKTYGDAYVLINTDGSTSWSTKTEYDAQFTK